MAMRELVASMRAVLDEPEPVDLELIARRQVPFAGPRGTRGPLTVGQANTLRWALNPDEYARMIQWVLDLPDGATLDDIAAALAVLMARHESLRTTYPAGQPVQQVAAAGELPIDVYAVDATRHAPAVLATALIDRLRSTEFDLASSLPLRVAVAVSQGIPTAAVALYSHVAADLVSVAVLGRQFTELAADPALREVGEPGHQPLDQAAAELSPRGRRAAAAALRNWESRLRSAPQCLYALPPARDAESGRLSGWIYSSAAALALPHIEARTGASRQAAVLAALCALLSRRTGQPQCCLTALLHNRYESRLRDYVGSLASDTMMSVNTATGTFDELVRRAAMTTLKAGKGGRAEEADLSALVREVQHDRGICYTRDVVYNDTSYVDFSPPAPPVAAEDAALSLDKTELQWAPMSEVGVLLTLILGQVEGEMVLGAMTCDTQRVSRDDVESLLLGVERLLVAAAPADVGMDRLGEITGVQPVSRGPGWLLIDSCWVELAEVARLVADALPGQRSAVVAEPAESGTTELVAYLSAGPGAATPAQAHAACMAKLPSSPSSPDQMRYTAMTPSRYVLCDGSPSQVADWTELPVLASGDGRQSVRTAAEEQVARPPARH